MEEEKLSYLMVIGMMEIIKMASDMARYAILPKIVFLIVCQLHRDYMYSNLGTGMKGNIHLTRNMAWESFSFQMAQNMMVSFINYCAVGFQE